MDEDSSRNIYGNGTGITGGKLRGRREYSSRWSSHSQTQPQHLIREDYINAYPQDRWLGPIWSAAQKLTTRGVESQREIGMQYYSVMKDGLLYLAKVEDPGLKSLCADCTSESN